MNPGTREVEATAPLLQRVADVGMLFLVFPLLVIGWSMALSLPAVIAATAVGLGEEALGDLLGGCVIAAIVPSALVASRRLVWWLRIEDDHLVLGPAWPRIRIALDDVEMLRVGSLSQRLRGVDDPLHVPLVITGHGRHEIQLRPEDADPLLKRLLKLCPNAAGISRTGKETLPANPEARDQGIRRLGRFWLWSGGVALVITIAIGLTMTVAALGDETITGAKETYYFFYLAFALGPAAGYAGFALRRARRARRRISRPRPARRP